MAARRSRKDRRPSFEWTDWREMMPALGLLGLVVGILVLTAVLRAPADDVADSATNRIVPPREVDLEATADRDEEPPSIGRSIDEPAPVPDSLTESTTAVPDDLETRARIDHGRLRAQGDGHTLQLLVACEPDNVRKLIERLGNAESLYVLPYDHQGRRCFRVCWGAFPDRDHAVADRSLPADVRRDVVPKEISLVTP